MEIKNVTVCGVGLLGGQIAFQTAFYRFNVVVYNHRQESLDKAKKKFILLGEAYKMDLNATQEEVDNTIARINFSTNLAEATKDADIVIESISENVQIKKDFYTMLGKVAPAKSIFCTNSSTLLPSMFAKETNRPERFLALHFANDIWKRNTAEIMKHAGTDLNIFDVVVEFAKSIGMIALPIYKEQPGYILNSLMVPFLKAAQFLYINNIADPQTVDKTWMKATGAPIGPFGIFDIIGIKTAYNIIKIFADDGDEELKKALKILQEKFIDKGKLGVSTGEGFYIYPHPKYQSIDFMRRHKRTYNKLYK